MSDTSKLTYRDLMIPYFLEVFQRVDDVMKANQAPYYLIGVNAADLQLLKEGVKPSRGTKDIDFAVMVSSFHDYDKIKDDLIVKGFNPVKNPFTLFHPEYNAAIDLLPFGQIEENDTVNFEQRETIMNVLGFKETLAEPSVVLLNDVLTVEVPPLHGMVVLKLIAWSDRPEIRGSDLEDIFRIVKHYYDVVGESIFDEYSDLLDSDPFDEKLIAARVMGRRISPILKRSAKLRDRVMLVLQENSSEAWKSGIGKHWAGKYNIELTYAIDILVNIKKGIEETE